MTEACCSHLTVKYTTETIRGGLTRGWWECQDCQTKFIPEACAAASPQAPAPPSDGIDLDKVRIALFRVANVAAKFLDKWPSNTNGDVSALHDAILNSRLVLSETIAPGASGLERIAQETPCHHADIRPAFVFQDKKRREVFACVDCGDEFETVSSSLEGSGGEPQTILHALEDTQLQIERMDASAEKIEGADGFIEGYKFKTGAWHSLLGSVRGGLVSSAIILARRTTPHDYCPEYSKAEGELDALRRELQKSQESYDDMRRLYTERDTQYAAEVSRAAQLEAALREADLDYIYVALIAASEAGGCVCKKDMEEGPCAACQANHASAAVETLKRKVAALGPVAQENRR